MKIKIIVILSCIIGPFILSFIINYVYLRYVKKIKRKKGSLGRVKKHSILRRIYIDFPYRLLRDIFERDPDEFREFGVRFICGEQGSGKTVFLTKYLLDLKKKYPKLKIQTNYNYMHEDEKITHWKDLIERSNGIYGYVNVLDEVQNWFNSLASKNFPPEMMTEISQQRKQRKLFLCTSQVFGRVAKPIREQAMLVYEPFTLFGCLTFVRCYKPYFDDTGALVKKVPRGFSFFVHTSEIRESYDTFKKVQEMSKIGFKSEELQIRNGPVKIDMKVEEN
ncbi:MAG: hypothetical protein GX892_11890 [Thermoanaerobacteraceae bacterium]|nr:hypothetical protein [Thermoanaerobacteraceae bacterium]